MPIQDFDFKTGKTVDPSLNQGLVVVADDEDVAMIKKVYREKHLPCSNRALNAHEALALVKKYKVGILFLDGSVDGINPKSVMEKIRINFPKIRIVEIESDEAKTLPQQQGVVGSLTKPLNYVEVSKLVDQLANAV